MAVHYTYLSPFIEDANWQKIATAAVLGAGLVILGAALTARLRRPAGIEGEVVPAARFSLFGFFDFFMEAFISYQDSMLGRDKRRYVGFTASIFIFILSANLLSLVPGIPASTTSVWINVGMALVVFVYFNYEGIKANGLGGYLKHFAGPIWAFAWLIFPVEVLSTCLRILTLNLRLYWNITADHMVVGTFTELWGLGAVPFYVLGTFVSFMQAFVFTTLTMVYILLATQHEGGEEHH